MNTVDTTFARITQCGLVPIIRGDFTTSQVLALAEVLREQGIPVLEVTANTTDALQTIAALRRAFSDTLLVGAGTIRSAAQLKEAVAAGAQFTIAPNCDPNTIAAARDTGILHLPGVLTPTEIQRAADHGCRAVKLFPADTFGPRYLKALRAPLDDLDFIPTGGISRENIADYADAGAVAVGVGSLLVTGPAQDLEDLARRAAELRSLWNNATSGSRAAVHSGGAQ